MKEQGFTLIEISIVLAIIVVLSTVAYANFNGASSRGEIINHAGKVLNSLRTAQANGVSGRTASSEKVYGWGLNLNRLTNKYTIFADYNDNGVYDYATKLLIHGSESVKSGGPTDAYFTESSSVNRSVTIWNGAMRESGAGKPSVTSGYWNFAGTSYLQVPGSEDFALGTKSFSFDLWFKASSLSADTRNLFYMGDSEPGIDHTSYRLYKNESDKIVFEFSDNNPDPLSVQSYSVVSPASINADTWYNVAVARDDSSLLLFLGSESGTELSIVSSTPLMSTTTNRLLEYDMQIANDGSCADNGCAWQGSIDEFRMLVGSPRFTKKFFMATTESKTDDEAFKIVKLPPGIVFERLYNNGIDVDELNLAWKIDDSAHLTHVDNLPNLSSSIIINHAGVEGTASSRDVPATINISTGGSFEKAGF